MKNKLWICTLLSIFAMLIIFVTKEYMVLLPFAALAMMSFGLPAFLLSGK
jgi:hypothetical protein